MKSVQELWSPRCFPSACSGLRSLTLLASLCTSVSRSLFALCTLPACSHVVLTDSQLLGLPLKCRESPWPLLLPYRGLDCLCQRLPFTQDVAFLEMLTWGREVTGRSEAMRVPSTPWIPHLPSENLWARLEGAGGGPAAMSIVHASTWTLFSLGSWHAVCMSIYATGILKSYLFPAVCAHLVSYLLDLKVLLKVL